MNVTVENLAPCKKLVRVEADAQTIAAAFEAITADFQRKYPISGFRKGKAPKDKVAKQFAKDIEKEVRQKLARESFQFALKDQKLSVVAAPQFEEVQFDRAEGLQFHFTIETAPEFELPDYKGLTVRTSRAAVTPEDIDRALTVLRERKGTYTDVDRPVENGDYVVVDYAGTCEGKPITDLVPTARGLTERKAFWLRIEKDGFLPGFAEQLVGAKAGDKRTVQVTFPPNFVEAALINKPAVYEVGIVQVKVRNLPALDDEFAKSYGAENLEKLREGVIHDLQNELKLKQTNDIRQQLLRALLDRLTFELPESLVLSETRSVVYNVVAENQKRGIPKETIDEKKDEIYNFANANAKERVKTAFVLGKIAEKENISASQDEMTRRVVHMSQQYQIAPEKLLKQLTERNAVPEIRDQIVHSKVLDFLQLHAHIEEDTFTPTVVPTA